MAPLVDFGSVGPSDAQFADERSAKIVKCVTWGWVDTYESELSAKRVRVRIEAESCRHSHVNLDSSSWSGRRGINFDDPVVEPAYPLPSLLRAANVQHGKDIKQTALRHNDPMVPTLQKPHQLVSPPPGLEAPGHVQKGTDTKHTALKHDDRMASTPQRPQQLVVKAPPGLDAPCSWQLHRSPAECLEPLWQLQQALDTRAGDWWQLLALAHESNKLAAARTTIMLRNIPNKYSREAVMALLDAAGSRGKYDFFYLPMDFLKGAAFGYAFVNFIDQASALQAFAFFDGFQRWKFNSAKVCEVRWSMTNQGLWQNLESFRNHSVMHVDVPEAFKPITLLSGRRVDFPPPTSFVTRPKGLRSKAGSGVDCAK